MDIPIQHHLLELFYYSCLNTCFYLSDNTGTKDIIVNPEYFKKILKDDNINYDDLDINMKKNAGLYYTNDKYKYDILNWWCETTIECIKKSELTSCLSFLHNDLVLWSLLDLKKNDEIKNVYCEKNGIKLFRIKYNDDKLKILKNIIT